MNLKLYQVYYSDKQQLDKDCIPYSTIGIDVSPYFENSIIKEISNYIKLSDCDYIGVTSWRLNEKTNLTHEKIKKFINDNPSYDVYTYGNYGSGFDLRSNKLNVIGIAWERIYQIKSIENKFDWINIFCNFWIIKKELLPDYVKFMSEIIDLIENDEVIKWLCSSLKFKHRDIDYPIQVFILEYAFGVWLVNNPKITYKSIPNKIDEDKDKVINLKESGMIKKRALNAVEETLADIYERHKFAAGYGDKGTLHHYIENYDKLFTPYRHKNINVLEIGVFHGHSVRMWREYFTKANITGIDINFPSLPMNGIDFYLCNQNDGNQLDIVLNNKHFDIIIDDGSHLIEHQVFSILHLWDRLNKGGIYVIEDMQNPEEDIKVLTERFGKPDIILDTRKESGRYDDMLLIWKK